MMNKANTTMRTTLESALLCVVCFFGISYWNIRHTHAQTPVMPPVTTLGRFTVEQCQGIGTHYANYDGVVCVLKDSTNGKEFVVSMWNGSTAIAEIQ